MKPINLKNRVWRQRVWAVVGFLVFLSIAMHPELRLLLPILDIIGVDVFVALIGLQVTSFITGNLGAGFVWCWARTARFARLLNDFVESVAVLRFVRTFVGYGVFHWLGSSGPRWWFRLQRGFRRWQQGPLPFPVAEELRTRDA